MARTEKVAIPLDFAPSIVALSNGDRMTRDKARAQGWKIYGEAEATAPDNEAGKARKAWRAQIMALPEVKHRESAVAELLATHTEQSMPVENARALLRGLPTERKEAPKPVTTNTHDPRAARKAEIAASMQAFNGRKSPQTAAKKTPSPALSGIEPAKLQRLAEIRLNALENDMTAPVVQGEAKKLRYALNVHSQTGMPLARVFTELNVDTTKLLSNGA